MARRYIPPVDPGLATAQGVVGGVSSFMQAFQGVQKDRRQTAFQEAQLASQRELHALQIQKLKKEMAPIELRMGMVDTLSGLGNERLLKKAEDDLYKSIETPEQLAYMKQKIEGLTQQDVDSATGPNARVSMGSAFVERGEPIRAQVSPPQTIYPNRHEIDLAMKRMSIQSTANLAGARIQAQESAAEMKARHDRELRAMGIDAEEKKGTVERTFKAGESAKERENKRIIADKKKMDREKDLIVIGIKKLQSERAGVPISISLIEPGRIAKLERDIQVEKDRYKALTGQDYEAPAPLQQPSKTSAKPAATPQPVQTPTLKDKAELDAMGVGPEFQLQGREGVFVKQANGKLRRVR